MFRGVAPICNDGGIHLALQDGPSQKRVPLPRFCTKMQRRRHTTHVYPYCGGEHTTYIFGKGFSQMSRNGSTHSAPADIRGSRRKAAEECDGLEDQDFNGDEMSGPYESRTSEVALSVGMESYFSGVTTNVFVFVRRAMRCTESCQHIRGCTAPDEVSAKIETYGTVTTTPVPLRRDSGRAKDPYRELVSCRRCEWADRRAD